MKPVPKAEGLCLAFVHVKPGVILHVQIVVFPSDVCIKRGFKQNRGWGFALEC